MMLFDVATFNIDLSRCPEECLSYNRLRLADGGVTVKLEETKMISVILPFRSYKPRSDTDIFNVNFVVSCDNKDLLQSGVQVCRFYKVLFHSKSLEMFAFVSLQSSRCMSLLQK